MRRLARLPLPVGPRGDLAALLTQDPADRLDRMTSLRMSSMNATISGCGGRVPRRRKPWPTCRISLSSRSRVLRLQALDLGLLFAGHTRRSPASISAWPTQAHGLRPTPSFAPPPRPARDRRVVAAVVSDHPHRPLLHRGIDLLGMCILSNQKDAASNPGRFRVRWKRSTLPLVWGRSGQAHLCRVLVVARAAAKTRDR